ncbi:MAG: hypothetical protein IPM52_05870 [Bacteroidetes bacterium]|nr:hypothetical protein [Bacteroidota bacterium]
MRKILALTFMMVIANYAGMAQSNFISQAQTDALFGKLKNESHPSQHERIARGVKQVAAFWRQEDGNPEEFAAFCSEYNATDEAMREAMFHRFQDNFELLWGSFNKISVGLKYPLHVDKGEIMPVDRIFGGYDAGAHLTDDFFANKLAFVVMLNFPFYTLNEKETLGAYWSRLEWAYARMGDVFKSRIPAAALQEYAQTMSNADAYISDYNIYMGNLRDNRGRKPFPKDLKLISHWGLRDEIKANYASRDGFGKQALIYEVMQRIIRQEIPSQVINNPDFEWAPFRNELFRGNQKVEVTPEQDVRYAHLLNLFKVTQKIDNFSPLFPNYITRKFEDEMEIPVEQVEAIFTDLVSHPVLKDVALIIEKRLGRKLQPWDIWYDGFKTRSTLDVAKLDQMLKQRYPDKTAFENDLPNILIKLGFNTDSAHSIAAKIAVDPSRGAGHAWGAAMRGDKARLRTRIGRDGMDYKGYNIAIHEFGHNVEQTISLYNVDYYILNGVPNTAFTEALAFTFQARDLELLGMDNHNEMTDHLNALDNIWGMYEIMGVSLVDINVWRWMYDHPDATPQELKKAVIRIATEVWNKYYAPVFGIADAPILAIYSHMIDYPLYLPAYPMGQIIEFQFGEHLKGKDFASEVYKAFTQGRLTPQHWMRGAVGSEISTEPIVNAAKAAVEALSR